MTDEMQSRLPDPLAFFPELGSIGGALSQASMNGAVPPATVSLVQLRAGQVVGSTYHTVLHASTLRKAGESEERLAAVASWRDAPWFTGAERAALELVEAVLTPNPAGERVPDELHARLAEHYDDKALWTLTVAIGTVSFFIAVALIAKPIPGRPIGQNYSPR